MVQTILDISFTKIIYSLSEKVSSSENYFVFVSGQSNREKRGEKDERNYWFMDVVAFDWSGEK